MVEKTENEKNVTIDIIIPTLNEGASLGPLLESIRSHKFTHTVSTFIIDGGSTDDTAEICKKHGVVFLKQKRKGKGEAMKQAVNYSNADIVVFMDGDDTYSINDFENIIQPLIDDSADMAVGSRINNQMEKGSITIINKIGNSLFNKIINFALKDTLTDSLSGYRAIRKEVFSDLVLLSNHFEIEVEMTVEALSQGYRIKEIPIKYVNRKKTETKLNPIDDGIKIGKTLLFVIMNIRPVLFFSIFASGFIGLGLVTGIWVLYQRYVLDGSLYTPLVVLTTLFIIMGTMSIVLGLISELIVRSRKRMEYIIKTSR